MPTEDLVSLYLLHARSLLKKQRKPYHLNVAMSSSDRGGDANDEKRTIGRKRRYQPPDESNESGAEDTSQSETEDVGEMSSPRWSSNNHTSLPDDAFQEAYDTNTRGSRSAQECDFRAPSSVSDATGGGGVILNPSFVVSASNSETNHNNNSTSDIPAFAARAPGNQFQAPLPPVLYPLGINQAAGMEQPYTYNSWMANVAANQANLAGQAGADMMSLYQLSLIQQMQQTLHAQPGGLNPGVLPIMPQQVAFNQFLAGNPYIHLLYQEYLANMAADAQRMQLAGLMSGAASAPSLSLPGAMGGQGASTATARGATPSFASIPTYAQGGYRQTPRRGDGGPILYLPSDDDILSDQQVLLRQQIELFAAGNEDVHTVTPGRRKEIVRGQVGIRCKYCSHVPIHRRTKGAVYYPAKLKGIYQAAQNMAASHFCEACENIDPFLKAELRTYQQGKSTSGHGGKQYWADSAKVLGVIETEEGLRFDPARKKGSKNTGKSVRR